MATESPFPANMAAVVTGSITRLFYVNGETGEIEYFLNKEVDEGRGVDYKRDNIDQGEPGATLVTKPMAAKKNPRLAATSYKHKDKHNNDIREIRLYFRDPENLLKELCWTEGSDYWYDGALSKEKFVMDPNGGLEAIITDKSEELKVYCLANGREVPTCWYAKWDSGGLWHQRLIKGQNRRQ